MNIQDYNNGYKITRENSENLFISAKINAKEELWGIARGLLVLSIEEFVKAFIFKVCELSDQITEKSLIKEYFLSHQHKHNTIIKYLNFFFAISHLKNAIEKSKLDPNSEKMIINFDEFTKNLKEPSSSHFANNKINDWLLAANSYKKDGFYVNFDSCWKSPNEITEIDYRDSLKMYESTKSILIYFLENEHRISHFAKIFPLLKNGEKVNTDKEFKIEIKKSDKSFASNTDEINKEKTAHNI